MNIPSHLIEIGTSNNNGLQKIAVLSDCQVSYLSHCVEHSVKAFSKVERRKHNRILILTRGDANIVLCDKSEKDDKPGEAYVIKMEKNVVYNIPGGTWHHIVLQKNAQVVFIDKNEKGEVRETELLERYVIKSCWREFNFNKTKHIRRKKRSKPKRISKELKKHLDSIHQLSIWPEYQ